MSKQHTYYYTPYNNAATIESDAVWQNGGPAGDLVVQCGPEDAARVKGVHDRLTAKGRSPERRITRRQAEAACGRQGLQGIIEGQEAEAETFADNQRERRRLAALKPCHYIHKGPSRDAWGELPPLDASQDRWEIMGFADNPQQHGWYEELGYTASAHDRQGAQDDCDRRNASAMLDPTSAEPADEGLSM